MATERWREQCPQPRHRYVGRGLDRFPHPVGTSFGSVCPGASSPPPHLSCTARSSTSRAPSMRTYPPARTTICGCAFARRSRSPLSPSPRFASMAVTPTSYRASASTLSQNRRRRYNDTSESVLILTRAPSGWTRAMPRRASPRGWKTRRSSASPAIGVARARVPA